MWYANPFIMLPATWLTLGGMTFISIWILRHQGQMEKLFNLMN